MLLGTDCSMLPELLRDGGRKAEGVFDVTTRAVRKKQEEEAEEYCKKMEDCSIQPRAIDENEEVWMKELDADLFSGTEAVKK